MVIDGAEDPVVAMVDAARLSPEAPTAWLTDQEVREAAAIASDRRRDEWTAGRIAAKYVFLHRDRFGGFTGSSPLRLRNLTAEDLAEFGPREYRSVRITKDTAPGGGPARAGWHSESGSIKVALSHTRGIACAFIGNGDTYSVDLEAPSRRVPAFYRQNFTPKERNRANTDQNPDWHYGLLWSAKECLLKTPRFGGLSLWNMPALEISLPGDLRRDSNITGSFCFLEAEVTSPALPSRHFQLAVSGTADLILTAITRLD